MSTKIYQCNLIVKLQSRSCSLASIQPVRQLKMDIKESRERWFSFLSSYRFYNKRFVRYQIRHSIYFKGYNHIYSDTTVGARTYRKMDISFYLQYFELSKRQKTVKLFSF